MANTIRTESELLSIFSDNSLGRITAQNLRDFVVSANVDGGGNQGFQGNQGYQGHQGFQGNQGTTGSTPAIGGSSGQVQFNSSGSLGGNTNLFWDATNHFLGVGTASPASQLQVNAGLAGTTALDARGHSSQSVNIFQVTDSTGSTVYAAVGSTGKFKSNASYGDIHAATDGSTITFDCDLANWHSVTLGGNRTLAVNNFTIGQQIALALTQDGGGPRTVTWFGGIAWAGGTPPTLSTAAAATDVFTIKKIGASSYLGFVAGQAF